MKRLICIVLLWTTACVAQVVGPGFVNYVTSAPSGSCSQNAQQQNVMGLGTIYTCQNGTWAQAGGGGGGGNLTGTLTSPKLPEATGAHTLGDSPVSDAGTSNIQLGATQTDDGQPVADTAVNITRLSSVGPDSYAVGLQSNVYTGSLANAIYGQLEIDSSVAGPVTSAANGINADVIVRAGNAATLVDQVNAYYTDFSIDGPGGVTEGNNILINGISTINGGTVTNAYGLHVHKMDEGDPGATNTFAVGIDNQGATRYAIKVLGGKSDFGPQTTTAGSVSTTALATTQLSVPGSVVATCAGACAGGTWTYKVQALDANGYTTTPSSAASATNATTLTTTNKNVITWAAVTNAVSYNVTRTASAGTPANLSLVCSATTVLTCTDDGSVNTASVTLPTGNSTGGIKLPVCPSGSSINFNVANMGLSDGTVGNGICFTANGLFVATPTHVPAMYIAQATVNKWSHHMAWSPNGTPPESGIGLTLGEDTGRGFDSTPFMFDIGHNDGTDSSDAYTASEGYSKVFTATSALTAGQVVKLDASNADSVVVATTTDTGAGAALGIVLNSPGAAGVAYVLLEGRTPLPLLGTGTCAIGNFVLVDTTTNGRVQCSSSAAGAFGYAASTQSSVGSAVTVIVRPPGGAGAACATCVVATSPGAGIAHFAGSTQTVTSSAVNLGNSDVTGTLAGSSLPTVTTTGYLLPAGLISSISSGTSSLVAAQNEMDCVRFVAPFTITAAHFTYMPTTSAGTSSHVGFAIYSSDGTSRVWTSAALDGTLTGTQTASTTSFTLNFGTAYLYCWTDDQATATTWATYAVNTTAASFANLINSGTTNNIVKGATASVAGAPPSSLSTLTAKSSVLNGIPLMFIQP